MKTIAALFTMTLLSGCQYLPMQSKEEPSGYFAHQHPAGESGGHKLRGYDFPPRHYF